MPRKATPCAPEVSAAIEEIKLFCHQSGKCILALSEEVEVSQSALARFVNGERKSMTPTARKVLEYIRSRHNWHNWHSNATISNSASIDPDGYQLIENAVNSLWDGKRHSAELLASLIRALKPALDMAMTVTSGGSRGS